VNLTFRLIEHLRPGRKVNILTTGRPDGKDLKTPTAELSPGKLNYAWQASGLYRRLPRTMRKLSTRIVMRAKKVLAICADPKNRKSTT